MKTAKKLLTISVIGCAAVCSAPAVLAQGDDVTMWPYLSGSVSYTFADDRRHSDDGVGGILTGGIPLNRYFNVELGGSFNNFNADTHRVGSKPWREYLAYAEGEYFYSRNPAFAPYFAVDLGDAHEHLHDTTETESALFAAGGVGAFHYFKLFKLDMAVRADFRYRWIDTKGSHFPAAAAVGNPVSSFGEPVISVGLVIPLGSHTKAAPVGETNAQPPPPVQEQKVAESQGPNRRFEDVHFAFDKSDLSPYAQASLDGDATTINKLAGQYPSLNVDVAGHTDWIGTDAYNQALSERRANAVKEYLVRKGVDSGHIRTYAYGESQPVAPNTTAEGRALNRRTEIRTSAGQ